MVVLSAENKLSNRTVSSRLPLTAAWTKRGTKMTVGFGEFGLRQASLAVAIAIATFIVLGTVSALWPNPFFMRMTPTAGFEIAILSVQSILAGLYIGIEAPPCASRTAGAGSILGFLGVACPVCNKLLVLAVGPALLLQYFEPVRLYVGLLGVALIAYAVWRKASGIGCKPVASPT